MPADVTWAMLAAVLIPVAVVTFILRQLPFSFLKVLRNNQLVGLLGAMMPVGVMVVLVIYTIVGQLSAPGGMLATALGCVATLSLHLWRRDAGLSIVGGTAAYVLLANFVF